MPVFGIFLHHDVKLFQAYHQVKPETETYYTDCSHSKHDCRIRKEEGACFMVNLKRFCYSSF